MRTVWPSVYSGSWSGSARFQDNARLGLGAARVERCAPDSHDPQDWTVDALRDESACLTVPVLGSLLSGAHLSALVGHRRADSESNGHALLHGVIHASLHFVSAFS